MFELDFLQFDCVKRNTEDFLDRVPCSLHNRLPQCRRDVLLTC